MPFVYSIVPGANVTTNATPNTETDHLRTVTGASRGAAFTGCYVVGKANAATSISGIAFRFKRFSTASTAGAGITPAPRDPSAPAAGLTAATAPTAGATPTLQLAFGCGKAGPGGWVARDPDSVIYLAAGGGASGNVDLFSASAEASLNFEYTTEHAE
jgi:hypothetical protein